jgi:hypothetical protein
MKKSSKVRMTLHRETLRTLASPETGAVQGGVIGVKSAYCISIQVSCATCNYVCVITGTSQAC